MKDVNSYYSGNFYVTTTLYVYYLSEYSKEGFYYEQ